MKRRWAAREDSLLGADTDAAIAARLGRTHAAVETRRRDLGIAAYMQHAREWTATEFKLLGTMSDADLAERLGCKRLHVLQTRQRRGIKAFSPANAPKKFRRIKIKRL